MGDAYQIRDQKKRYFLTFQLVVWVDVFVRKVNRDLILENIAPTTWICLGRGFLNFETTSCYNNMW